MKKFIFPLIILLSLIGCGPDYDLLRGDGITAFAVAVQSKIVDIPAPIDCPCKGTGKVKSGDGILDVKCPCGDNCKCKKEENKSKIKIILITSDNCIPCQRFKKKIKPSLEKAGWKFGKDGHIEEIQWVEDVGKQFNLQIDEIPTFIRFENDKITQVHIGYLNAAGVGHLQQGKVLTKADEK